jgi:hypothetical protein
MKWFEEIFSPFFKILYQNLMQGENQITEAQITLPALTSKLHTLKDFISIHNVLSIQN